MCYNLFVLSCLDQLKESEDHCKELEKQLAAMVQQNLNAQLIEAELRDQLVDSVSHSQLQEAKKHLAQCEKVIVSLYHYLMYV